MTDTIPLEQLDDPGPDPPHDIPTHTLDQLETQAKAERHGRGTAPAGRVPPHNLQAEAALLGALLLSRKAIDDTQGIVTPDDFYKPAHAHIHTAILALHARAQPVDTTTVADALNRAGQLDLIGGPATLATLQADTPTTTHAERYAQTVADHAAMRHLIRAGHTITDLGHNLPTDIAATLDQARDLIENIADPDPPGATPLADTIPNYRATIAHRQQHGDPTGILSGLADLDKLTGGFRPGQLVCICGRTSMGKTAVAGQLLAQRLRNVRVCCGDWARVVTTGALNYGATVGILLDPPYLGDVRTSDLYAVDDHTIAHAVREWAIANGDNPRHRIALCGYEPEHIDHMPDTWRMHSYSASKSYGSKAGGGVNDANRALERIWFSPHCLTAETQGTLFGGEAA